MNELKILSSDIYGNTFIYKGEEYKTKLSGKHQVYNAVTAIEAAKTVGLADDNGRHGDLVVVLSHFDDHGAVGGTLQQLRQQ